MTLITPPLKNPYGFAFARNKDHARRLRNVHLKRPGVNQAKVTAAYNQALRNLQSSPYTTKVFPKGASLYRASSAKKYDSPSNIGFYAVDKKTRQVYRWAGRRRSVDFTTTQRLRLFVMNKNNLMKLIADHPTDQALVKAVANVTSVGLARGASFYRHRGLLERYKMLQKQYAAIQTLMSWMTTPMAFFKAPVVIQSVLISPWSLAALSVAVYASGISNLKPTRNASVLHVATENYLSKENKKADVYAAKRLALEMKRVLRDLGYDGWVYETNAAIRASTPISLRRDIPFHEEVMVWNNDKVTAT